jgi:subtilisin family serine protease
MRTFARVAAALGLLSALAAGPAAAQDAGGAVPLRPQGIVPGEYIVVLRDEVADPAAEAAALGRALGFSARLVYSHALKGFAAAMSPAAAAALGRSPRVAHVEPDQDVQAFAQTVPTGIRRIFADGNPKIGIDGHDDTRVDVDVAVIDTGIDYTHPDLNVVARTDCTGGGPMNQTCVDGSGSDGNGHGTHVAGTIGALDNGVGVVGVAPGARLHAVKVLSNSGSGYMSWIVAGIDWVTAHAGTIEVANMSLGCECSSAALDQAISSSVAAGVVYAVAAGNNDKDAATFSPANHPDVITVSALADFNGLAGGGAAPTCRSDQDDTLADFSNWGSKVEIAAPGVCILSTWKGGGYNTISGTSMASPHVAGAAALLKASGVSAPATVRSLLVAKGNPNWSDDSDDGFEEPLLDVGDSGVFAPATVAGSESPAEPPPANTAPTVAITGPADGTAVTQGDSVTFTGTANDTQDGDLTSALAWTSSLDGSIGSGGSFSTSTLSVGTHTITAAATDLGGLGGSASITLTVNPAPGAATSAHVAGFEFWRSGGKTGTKNLNVTVTVVNDLGQPVGNAAVTLSLSSSSGKPWGGTGTTNAGGQVTFARANAPTACYTATVTDIAAAGLTFDATGNSNQFCG